MSEMEKVNEIDFVPIIDTLENISLNDNDERVFPVTAFVLNGDGTYGEYKFENFMSAARDLKSEIVIGIIADNTVMDVEFTYTTAQAFDCKDIYSKSIFWNRKDKND